MRNKNLVTAKGGEVTAPLTRARSAAFRACGQRPPLKVPIQQNHKRTLQGIPNSTDLDENNNNAPNNACCCKRKRAVLQDVANFCCKCSQRNCLNAAKIQAKINKPTRKGQVKVCKVAPSVALEAPLFQAASETKILQEMVKIESKSKEVISSNDLEEKVSLQLSNIRECAIDDHRLENQSFGMPSQPQFPPKKVKGGFSGDMTISSDLDIIDIDADLKEPRLCSIYAPDIYSNLRVAELARRPCPHFMETIQQDITQSMRGMLVDWLVEVSEGCKLASNTLYLTIYLIDWYLTGNCIERQRLQLLGITCMLLASKYEEGHAPHVEEFCLITGDTYTREEVLELEIQISKYLGFQLFSPTAKTFLRRFLNPLAVVLDIPRNIWRQTLRPLSDFGFGRRSIWEGGVGLFLVSGAVLFALSLAWLRGFQMRSKFRKYFAVFEFAQASGICTGTPVRIRGVTVGNVIRVNPSLKSIEAVVEVEDDKIIIPQNSLIEVNQSGLLMETMIDITPRDPIPIPSVGPLDPECVKEGLILCDRQKLKGDQGVSLDALVGIFTRLGREVEEIGIANTYSLAERVSLVIEEAKPLLTKVKAMADDVQPLLAEVRDSGLLKEVENLTRSLTQASEDLREVHSSIMTPENTELIQKSIYTLIFTLKNIENISSDILGFTGDDATRRNLKLLIKSLSRLL